MSAAVVSLSVVATSRDDGPDRPMRARSQWSSQDSASPSSSSSDDKKEIGNQGHAHDVDDDDDSTFSIDMNDLKRDLGMEVKPSVDDGTGSASFPSPVSNTATSSIPFKHNIRSPSPIEVTVQRLPLVKLNTPTQLNTSSNEKETINDASAEKVGEVNCQNVLNILLPNHC